MKTLILCGGKGTRAHPYTVDVPKPLIEIAGRPVLRHVMEIYAEQGFTEFVLAAGFKKEMIDEFSTDLPAEWDVAVIDTGEETKRGERVARCRDLLDETFFLTYADGVGNVDLGELREFHESHGGRATVTIVPLPSQYGTIEIDETARVERFVEKPVLPDHWINAGFFVMDPTVFADWSGPDLERDVLPVLSAAGQLYAYRHRGFWRSMDTYKDARALTALCDDSEKGPDGKAPWFNFATHASW